MAIQLSEQWSCHLSNAKHLVRWILNAGKCQQQLIAGTIKEQKWIVHYTGVNLQNNVLSTIDQTKSQVNAKTRQASTTTHESNHCYTT